MSDSEIQQTIGEILQWQKDHSEQDATNFKAIADSLALLPKKDEIGELMLQSLKAGGTVSFRLLVGLSVLIGAMAVIVGGLKSVTDWLHIGFLK